MEQKTMLVSVIILLNEQDNFLQETIDSIRNQDYRPLEIIVIDGSVYGKGAEIDQNLLGIQYYHQPNRHKSIQRNFGLRQARGEAIAFLNAGDMWTPHKLSSQVNYLRDYTDVDIVQGAIQNIPAAARYSSYLEDFKNAYEFIDSGSLTYRRSVFEKVGFFDETLNTEEEIDWFLRAWEKNIIKKKLKQISLFHRQPSPEVLIELARSYQLRLLKVLKKSINRKTEKIERSVENLERRTNLGNYIGDPRQELSNSIEAFSVIADDCWGLGPYIDFGMKYNTPFIGIRIEAPCYLKLLKDLQGYLESSLKFINQSKYKHINNWREQENLSFPIARLKNDVELLFYHESEVDICQEKWQRRLDRINWNNLFVKFREDIWFFQPEYLSDFHQLQYEYKICFTRKEYPEFDWAVPAPALFEQMLGTGGDMYIPTKKYFDALNWVSKSYGANPSAYKIKQSNSYNSI